eukprot:Hpha_TRINITY_DN15726_c2_g3::TRINITY_DN15726_c2_g3_i1::g.40246::m.40246
MGPSLPQVTETGEVFLTDSGIETVLLFERGIDLPEFAAFITLESEEHTKALKEYYQAHIDLCKRHGHKNLVLDSCTWRASQRWADKISKEKYPPQRMAELNKQAVQVLHDLRTATSDLRILISGNVGPRDDAYAPATQMNPEEAEAYHTPQLQAFKDSAGVDQVSFITCTYPAEGVGVARAAEKLGLPVVISFTTETDGKLPNGDTLQKAVEEVDKATGGYPTYFMINCSYPTHFRSALDDAQKGEKPVWLGRVRGVKANASAKSHAELDEATELDAGDKKELGSLMGQLRKTFGFNVLGGCCGTNHGHIEEMLLAAR